jgi:TolB-like protein/Flp pilus assembly protein TadD
MAPTSGAGSFLYRFASYELDSHSLELHKCGMRLNLAPQPARLLVLLVRHAGELVSREEIQAEIWGGQTFVDFNAGLNYCLNCIRSALCDDAKTPKYIQTLPRRGYRFIAAVEVLPQRLERSLAVLPFDNLNGDAGEDWLAAGLTEMLTTELGRDQTLRVISRRSVLHLHNLHCTAAEIAHRLRIGSVVQGAVLVMDGRIRITVQLIETKTETHLWTEVYEGRNEDLFALQARIARDASAKIHGRATSVEVLPAIRAIAPQAHVAYLKGQYHMEKMTAPGLELAFQYYQQAIQMDPQYAAPLAGLAQTYNMLGWWGHTPEWKAYPIARETAMKALALEPSMGLPHRVLGWIRWVHDWDPSAGEAELRIAINLTPGDAVARLFHAFLLAAVHRNADQALAEMRTALEIDPLSRLANTNAAWIPMFVGNHELASELAEKALEIFPDAAQAYYVLGQCELARSRYPEAAELFRKAASISPDPIPLGYLGHALGLAGRSADARALLDDLLSKSQSSFVIPRCLLWIRIGLGELDEAFRMLDEAVESRSSFLWWLRSVPLFEPLRSDARYEALVRKVGFPAN